MRLRILLAAVLLTAFLPAFPQPAQAAAPGQAPVLTQPADGSAYTPDTVLRWQPVPGAAKYEVQIATDDAFGNVVYDKYTTERSATPTTALPEGTLYWHVRATDTLQNVGPASPTWALESGPADQPTPISPEDGEQKSFPDDPPVFSWTPVDGAKSYKLEIDDAADFVNPTAYTTNNTSYTLTAPQTFGQTYCWRVTATLLNGQSGQPSAPRSYSVTWNSLPTLVTPEADGTVADVVFSWQDVFGAATYNLQVSTDVNFANSLSIDAKKIYGTRYSPASTLPNGTYFWRVQAVDALSDKGSWSDVGTFTRSWVHDAGVPERPVLISPAYTPGGAIPHVSGDLGLSWYPIHHASSYEIEVSTDPNFSPNGSITRQCVTNRTVFQPYDRIKPGPEPNCGITGLSTGVAYYWHVRGIDDPAGVRGVWSNTGTSDTWQFIIDPAAPDYLSPADGAQLTDNLSWTPVQGAETYKVTILKDDGVAVFGSPFTTYATSFTPTAPLPHSTYYTWYVQAVDTNGDTSLAPGFGARRTFTIGSRIGSSQVTLTAPADGASGTRMPAMSWSAPSDATSFDVYYGINNKQVVLAANLPYPSFTATTAPLGPGTYSWWVVARTASGTVISAAQTFAITDMQVLGTSDYLAPSCASPTPCQDTPTLSWNAAPGAGYYVVTLANDPHFTNIVREWGTPYTSLTPRESLGDNQAGQSYYWFVRPCVDRLLTRCGAGPQDDVANRNAARFQKQSAGVTGLEPADGTSGVANQVTFRWDDYLDTNSGTQEAKQYAVQVSTKQDFSALLDSATVDQTTYTAPSMTYPEGPIYWRVQAVDGSGNKLTPSATYRLGKQSPSPMPSSPFGGATEAGVPTFQWQPQHYAAGYSVEVYKNGDTNFSPTNLALTATTKYTSWAPTQGLPSGTYAWRVRAIDAGLLPEQWSAASLFVLAADAPALQSPADGANLATDDLVFTWQPSDATQKVAQYRWQLSSSPGFTAATSVTTVAHAWAPLSALQDGTYYWRVQVLDGAGNVLASSPARALGKDTTTPKVVGTGRSTDLPVASAVTVTFSEPVQHVSGTSFRMTAGTKPVPARVTASATTASLTPLTPLVPGQHYQLDLSSAITDAFGNPLAPYSWSMRTTTFVENDSPAVVERWDHDVDARASGGGYDSSATPGALARFTFTGTGAALLGARMPDGGSAAVYLDGAARGNAAFYSPVARWRQAVWTAAGLPFGQHTVELRVLAIRPKGSSGSWVRLDALTVGQSTREESAAVETFRRVSDPGSSGTDDVITHATSGDNGGRPSWTMTFRGTSVYVYGLRSPSTGKAACFVDGRLVQVATTTYRQAQSRMLICSATHLTDAVHTIRVEVVGTPAGVASNIGLDYLNIL